MALVSSADIGSIYPEATKVAGLDLTPFIVTADILITEELANAGLTIARLTEIEKYLAAHYACISIERGGLSRQRIGESEDYYKTIDPSTIGLSSTRFGQQAIMLDGSGTLGALSEKPVKAQFRVVGSKRSEKLPPEA